MTWQSRKEKRILPLQLLAEHLWILDDIRPLRKVAANKGMAITNPITVFTAPEAYQAQYRAATGYEWRWMVYGMQITGDVVQKSHFI